MSRPEGPTTGPLIRVFIDNCVWDYLFERGLDLARELPSDRIQLFIPREIEFEIEPIRDAEKRRFIAEAIARANVRTWRVFSFFDERHTEEEQRGGGFGDLRDPAVGGVWIESDEAAFDAELAQKYLGKQKKPSTRLYRHEADIALAVRSLHSVVLTLDKASGPLRDARSRGGKVIDLNDFDPDKSSLVDFVLRISSR